MTGAPGQGPGIEVIHDRMGKLGCLTYLAAHCPVHSKFSVGLAHDLFVPAVERGCLRLFRNDGGLPVAALIWARLSDDISRRMIFDRRAPRPTEWDSGDNLWFLDLLAPFGHGGQVARHIARNPPDGPFYFARIGPDGSVRRVVEGNARRAAGQRLRAFAVG